MFKIQPMVFAVLRQKVTVSDAYFQQHCTKNYLSFRDIFLVLK